MAPPVEVYNGDHHVAIGNLSSVTAKNFIVQVTPTESERLLASKLKENIAPGSMHDSDERCDAPKCDPGTRITEQADICSWILGHGIHNDGSQQKGLMWLTGWEESGKTTIMGSLADQCQKDGTLAASFFFSCSSKSSSRRSKRCLVATIAFQLFQHDSLQHIRPWVLSSIERNPLIFTKKLEVQLEELILRPLREMVGQSDLANWPKVILIDALDECEAEHYSDLTQFDILRAKWRDQIEVLQTFLVAVQDPYFPFRVIITSRPDKVIHEVLTAKGAGKVTHIMFLDEAYTPNPLASTYTSSLCTPTVSATSTSHKIAWEYYGETGVACLEKLRDHITPEAIYTPRLWNDTLTSDSESKHRDAMQADIIAWLFGPRNEPKLSKILRVTEPVGSVTMASLLWSVAEEFQERRLLAASFSFTTMSETKGVPSTKHLIVTLAYQLLQLYRLEKHQDIYQSIITSIEDNPGIFEASPEDQLEAFILEPLRQAEGLLDRWEFPKVILIDGIDHCVRAGASSPWGEDSNKTQVEIIHILKKATDSAVFPFRIIFSSRTVPQPRDIAHLNLAAKLPFLEAHEDEDEKLTRSSNCPLPTDIVIPILGLTGAGKSTVRSRISKSGEPLTIRDQFINYALRGFNSSTRREVKVGHGLDSCTTRIEFIAIEDQTAVHMNLKARRVVLVDTPGFDNAHVQDGEILRRIVRGIKAPYRDGMMFGGVIYVHDISQDQFPATAQRNIKIFHQLLGWESPLNSLVLVTSKWRNTSETMNLKRREQKLKGEQWKGLLDGGASIMPLQATEPDSEARSARLIVEAVLAKVQSRECQRLLADGLKIQQEMARMHSVIPLQTKATTRLRHQLQQMLHAQTAMMSVDADAAAGDIHAKNQYRQLQENVEQMAREIRETEGLGQRLQTWLAAYLD